MAWCPALGLRTQRVELILALSLGLPGLVFAAADPQHILEGLLELVTGAGIDRRVDAAVEIAQPEGNLEDDL